MANKIKIISEITKEDCLYYLCESLSHNELIKFIVDLDLSVADWNFTIALIKHFKALEEEYVKDVETEGFYIDQPQKDFSPEKFNNKIKPITHISGEDNIPPQLCLTIGNQTFTIQTNDSDLETVKWYEDQLNKALKKITNE